MRQWFQALCIFLTLSNTSVFTNETVVSPAPLATTYNPGPAYSFINSIEHHPYRNLFCITVTHNNKVILYEVQASGHPKIVQTLSNPLAQLSAPQHATFTPDGEKMVVANWSNQTLTVYPCGPEGYFQEEPAAVISSPTSLLAHKPHGIAFSPCGRYLAIAYGATHEYGKAVALYFVSDEGLSYELVHLLEGPEYLSGTPKGITFSPDGTCLLVTLADAANELLIFNLSENRNQILIPPRQIIRGEESGIFRPEDVKISPHGRYCAISNSDKDTVTFYAFDKTTNLIAQNAPIDSLQNPDANLCFPHGIAFSPDGLYVFVSEFGKIHTNEEGHIAWNSTTKPQESKFHVYQLLQ